jgi:hypothetical protein
MLRAGEAAPEKISPARADAAKICQRKCHDFK